MIGCFKVIILILVDILVDIILILVDIILILFEGIVLSIYFLNGIFKVN